MKTGIIILAAGASTRLGRPKQLIQIQGKTLLQRTIDSALKSEASSLVVVLGWNPELIQGGINSNQIPFVINEEWEEGMATSMQAGLKFLMNEENPDQVVLLLCDQALVTSSSINDLIALHSSSKKGIVASSYSNTLGVPALFDKAYFPELLALKSTEGAKKVILKNQEDVAVMDFPEGAIDLDTEEDFERLKRILAE
ncbi:molybdenum cofactor cytidylyltransferase [Algoriphagus boseongensis]|uniref:Molybdenum cofactor cytidylyltransferase n=1 Tax=Algoriphagus boseongensis TaxID=1442587 RepID=A0A4R6T7Q6_9BACT|nr:nucleotidyltransferase family protein [Algoriphagus boseongensis]TDQ19060.1 molybdenum cofactor cytidylyltransferase [Algoriphagus boseongensis]